MRRKSRCGPHMRLSRQELTVSFLLIFAGGVELSDQAAGASKTLLMRIFGVHFLLPNVATSALMQDLVVRLTIGRNAVRFGWLIEARRVMGNDAADLAPALVLVHLLAACGRDVERAIGIISEHVRATVQHCKDSRRFTRYLAHLRSVFELAWGSTAGAQILLQATLLARHSRLLGRLGPNWQGL